MTTVDVGAGATDDVAADIAADIAADVEAEVAVEAGRHPGRPRSQEADRAILRATLDLLAEEGYGGVTMEGVAARAGCGKTTIYRRWPSKADMVVDAVRACKEVGFAFPDTGSARDNTLAYVRDALKQMRKSDAGRIMPGLVAELARNAELAKSFREGLVQPRRARVVEMLRRGVESGELRDDVDLDIVADVMVAVLQHRLLVTGMKVDDDLPNRVVDLVWRGIAAGSTRPGA